MCASLEIVFLLKTFLRDESLDLYLVLEPTVLQMTFWNVFELYNGGHRNSIA